MRYQRYILTLALLALCCSWLPAQGLNTTAGKDDWEEINFEFNQSVLVDGFPSMLRMADLLRAHPDYRLKLEGHADQIGSNRYNQRLGQRRADAVREFLLKYGASGNQITATTFGESQPKVPSRGRNARFMNRRVMMTLTDGEGRVIGAGTIAETLRAAGEKQLEKCCADILKRLDRLDEIADMLKRALTDNESLRKEVADLRKGHADLDTYVRGLPKPLTSTETAQIVDTRTAEQIERARMPRYSTMNLNVGADSNGDLTFTGRGRLFMPFKEQFAVQLQGEYMYFRDRQEGQVDFGLVNRFVSKAQAGIFGSMKYVSLGQRARRGIFEDLRLQPFVPATGTGISTQAIDGGMPIGSGLLGQASATLDYLFSRGRFGLFGSKGFLNEAMIGRTALSQNLFNEFYIRTVDQFGLSTTLGLMGDVYLEANLGYLRSRGYADRPGGTARFVFPISDRFAFTVEGGMNETLLTRENWGRVVAGFQFGNFQRPKDYMTEQNGVLHAVPADIPRVRWELLTRRVRTGNGAPTVDAGPDQIGVAAGPITLTATAFDPEGDPVTFRWMQIAGPAVSLSGMNTATATFTAEEGQTYAFRVIATDTGGAQGIARVSVSTARPEAVEIVRFQASPTNIRSGQSSTIDWQVLNADTVTITPDIGTVEANGSRQVSPTRTTNYRLTARNAAGEVTATTTVVVEANPPATLTACQVQPTNIMAGETATIFWSAMNSTSVNITGGVGSVDASGSRTVSPTQTTTYTITAQGATGTNPATCTVTLRVTAGTAPRVVSFSGSPLSIQSGQSSTLTWNVENADTVSISGGIGSVDNSGSRSVSPTQTTTYTLTATNAAGSTTATVTINVTSAGGTNPTISACTVTPSTSTGAGAPVSLSWNATNATSISISGVTGTVPVGGPFSVNPQETTTYTITATGAQGTTPATCTVTVTVPTAPQANISFSPGPIVTSNPDVTISASVRPATIGLTYNWMALTPGLTLVSSEGSVAVYRITGDAGEYAFSLTVMGPDGFSITEGDVIRYRPVRPDVGE